MQARHRHLNVPWVTTVGFSSAGMPTIPMATFTAVTISIAVSVVPVAAIISVAVSFSIPIVPATAVSSVAVSATARFPPFSNFAR